MIAKPAVILYVEHNKMLLQTVRDVLEFAGWYVKPCTSGGYAVANNLIELVETIRRLLGARAGHS